MTDINVVAAPTAKNRAAFAAEVRNSISKIANLAGWRREERETLMDSVEEHRQVAVQWELLQHRATATAEAGISLPIWEWNRHVRNATDLLVEGFYRGG
jgi:hypothetical protein